MSSAPVTDLDRPVLLALVGWIRHVVRENRKAAEGLSKEPEFMHALREGFEQWMKTQQKLAAAKVVREARSEGKAESLLAVLEARRIPISKKLRAQIMACADNRMLDLWIRRAASASSVKEVIETAN